MHDLAIHILLLIPILYRISPNQIILHKIIIWTTPDHFVGDMMYTDYLIFLKGLSISSMYHADFPSMTC